jgi:hypothetical protein
MCLESKRRDSQEAILGAGGRRSATPAIRRLHVRDGKGPAIHEMLRFNALHAIESK